MNIDEKINILLILVSILLFFILVNATVRIKNEFSNFQISSRHRKLNALDSEGEFLKVISLTDSYLKKWPNEASFKWSKARALFKLKKYSDSLVLFKELESEEPLWVEDAKKYIATINAQSEKHNN